MADYWKSQPRKFCQYCKCWIADNKPSIEFHERGKNHKENVAAKFNDIRKKSVNKAKQEAKQSKQFAAMEEAALKAYEQDLKRMEMEASGIRLEAPTSSLQEVLPLVGKASQNKAQGQGRKQTNKKQKSEGPSFPGGPDAQFWVAGKSDDGNTYYYNTVTGESRWNERHPHFPKSTMPAQLGGTSASTWVEAVSPEGYPYYYNSQTGESSWEKPASLASKDAVAPGGQRGDGAGETQAEAEKDKHCSEAVVDPEASGALGQGAQEPCTNLRKRKADDDPPEEDEKSKSSALVPDKSHDDEKEGDNQTGEKTDEMASQARRRVNPYGAWERIKVEKKTEKFVDLQLPKVQEEVGPPPPPDVPPEPKPKFKERIITSLGVEGGPVAFKKKQNGKSRSLRQRDADD
ncbi:WW domain-binding protein 4 [Synchiropus picturatus]